MKQLIFSLLCILVTNVDYAQIIHVPENRPSIQGGIDIANDGDTVLVQPGIYYENINYKGKNITVASLYLITQDTSYISQTIIDGNQKACVVIFEKYETSSAEFNGFTVRNGNGSGLPPGGGISCFYSTPSIKNSVIKNNTGGGIWCASSGNGAHTITLENLTVINNGTGSEFYSFGGGIYCDNMNMNLLNVKILKNFTNIVSPVYNMQERGGGLYLTKYPGHLMTVYLSGTTITGNLTNGYGGGIAVFHNDTASPINLVFDSINRCNIYSNKGAIGADLFSIDYHEIICDTFSVLTPTDFHTEPLYNFVFDIQNAKFQQFNSDLYVSPDGDNSNSGLTADDPLKSINHALMIIQFDSMNPHSIKLQPGIYSASDNDELFPINVPNFLNIYGTSNNQVFLDAEQTKTVMTIINNESNIISDVCLINGFGYPFGGGIFCTGSNPVLQDMRITACVANGLGDSESSGGGAYFTMSSPTINNLFISENSATRGGGIYTTSELNLSNTVIDNNRAWRGGGIFGFFSNSVFNNITLTNNTCDIAGGMYYSGTNNLIINSIIYNNTPHQIAFKKDNYYAHIHDTIAIAFSNIQNGIDGIDQTFGDSILWLEGNIAMDPQFIGYGNNPYDLKASSPCIDTGTSDTTGLNLFPSDILGNLRIWDGNGDGIAIGNGIAIIDMGAYEFGAPHHDNNDNISNTKFDVTSYPNPFSDYITIAFNITAPGIVKIELFDNLGRKIEDLINENYGIGEHQVGWFAKKNPSGIYFYKLEADDKVSTGKIILIR